MESIGEATDQDILEPDFLSKVAWLLPVVVVRLHDGDLHAVGWGEGP